MAQQRIVRVEQGSAAGRAGIREGDVLLKINDRPVKDLIDYQVFVLRRHMRLDLLRDGCPLKVEFEKDPYEPLGLGFEQMLMSPQRACINRCMFCFVDQLPEGVRPSLKIKDDDWRMSLMMGSFVTLTNVSDEELSRIIRRKCSPLYISVHTVNPELRAKMLGQKKGEKIMEQLGALRDGGLSFHTQAVLCPGINDGDELDRTMEELYALYPAAQSLALVPVGLTGHRDGLCPIAPFDKDSAARVLDQAERMRKKCLSETGDPFVHPADELYILAGRDFPPEEEYGDYPQIENGVGLCRLLESQYREAWEETDFSRVKPGKIAVACGVSVAPFLKDMLACRPVPGVEISVHPVENRFFGKSVTVSGLVTGGDLVRTMKGAVCDRLLISAAMLREGETVFLDDMTLEQAEKQIGVKITVVDGGQALVKALSGGE